MNDLLTEEERARARSIVARGRAENRSQLMELLGAKQANTMWAWCGVNEERHQVFFSAWTDLTYKLAGETRYVIQEPHWGIDEAGRSTPPRNDHDAKLRLVFEYGYEPFVYFIDAENPNAKPRKIAGTKTSFVMRVKLSRTSDGQVYGTQLERIDLR